MADVNLFKRAVYKFNRRAIESDRKGHILGVDLADFSKEEGANRGFLLVAIDYYTRKLFTRIMATKKASDLETALKSVIAEMGMKPQFIHSDKEAGLVSNQFLRSEGIQVYHTEFLGSPIAERVIRTLKEWIEPLRSKSAGRGWKQHVDPVTEKYNSTKHTTIKMAPNEAWNNPNSVKLQNSISNFEVKGREGPKSTFNIGDRVVVVREKAQFEKGYKQRWNKTIHKIKSILLSNPVMYELDNGKNYYTQQLQKVEGPEVEISKPAPQQSKKKPATTMSFEPMTLRSGKKF